jgi:hypothetical protein
MAKLMSPLASSEARGRIGGLIHNTWRGISYAKSSSSPAQPRSKLQLQMRAWTTMLVRYWGTTLTDAERVFWNDYASTHSKIDWTGNARRLTGLNWFVLCNIGRLRMALTVVTTPPAVAAPNAPAAFAAADGVLQSILTWTSPGGTGITCDVFHLGPVSKGVTPNIQRAKFKDMISAETHTMTCAGLAPGRHWFFARMIDESNGLVSPWVLDSCDITAV